MEDWKKADPGKPVGQHGAAMLLRMNNSHRALRSWGFEFIEWNSGMDILDTGCGGGAAIYEMLGLSDNCRIWGVDYSPESVRISTEINSACIGSQVFICEGDVSSLPFENEKFDLVTAIETVYFWPDIEAGIGEIYRVIKHGGKFAVMCEVDGPERMDWEKVNFDIKVYRPEELEFIFGRVGFEKVFHKTDERGYMIVIGIK